MKLADKHERKEEIKDIIKKHGPLDSNLIKTHMLAKLRCKDEEYSRSTFQKDIQDLVESGAVQVERLGKRFLYQIDPDELDVEGMSLIRMRSAILNVPGRMKRDVRIKLGKQDDTSQTHISIYFELIDDLLCLQVDKEALPFKLNISRTINDKSQEALISQAHGERCLSLEVPIKRVSSSKDAKITGHTIIRFSPEGIDIEDLKSTYGTSFMQLNEEERMEMLNKASPLGNQTEQTTWPGTDKSHRLVKLIPMKTQVAKLPFFASCSEYFKLLIC